MREGAAPLDYSSHQVMSEWLLRILVVDQYQEVAPVVELGFYVLVLLMQQNDYYLVMAQPAYELL